MKFTFYSKGKKKKSQVVKINNKNDFKCLLTLCKCEITKESILHDLDFSSQSLICEYKGKEYSMKKLYDLVVNKLMSEYEGSKDSKKKKQSKSKKKDKKTKPSGKKSKKDKKDKKKKKKKSKSKDSDKSFTNGRPVAKTTNKPTVDTKGLIHISRR